MNLATVTIFSFFMRRSDYECISKSQKQHRESTASFMFVLSSPAQHQTCEGLINFHLLHRDEFRRTSLTITYSKTNMYPRRVGGPVIVSDMELCN